MQYKVNHFFEQVNFLLFDLRTDYFWIQSPYWRRMSIKFSYDLFNSCFCRNFNFGRYYSLQMKKKNIIKKFITFKLKFKILPEKIFGFALEDRRQFQITRPWSKAQDTKFQPSWYEKLREQDRRFCELTTAVIPRRNVHSPSNVVNLPACLHPWTIFQIQICYEKGEEILGPLFSILSSFQNSSFWSLFFRLDKAKLPDMLPTSSQINNK